MREYIVFSIVVIVGLVCMVLSQNLSQNQWITPYLDAVSSTLLMGGILGVLYKKFVDGAHYKEIKRLLGIHEAIEESGFIEYHPKVNEFNYADLIDNSRELTVIVNDGLSWVKYYADDLRSRFNRDTKTIVYNLDPDSEYIPALAKKVNYPVEEYRSKLETAKTELTKLHEESSKRGKLEIYRMKNYPTHSVYLTEKFLVVTPYQMSSQRMNIPALLYDARDPELGLCACVLRDLRHINEESTKIYPATS